MVKKQSPTRKSAKKGSAKKSAAKKSAGKKGAAKKGAAKKSAATKGAARATTSKKSRATTRKSGALASVVDKAAPASVADQIDVKQSSEYMGNNWWKWSVWIDAPSTVLNNIESVTYKLHSTFDDRVREQTNVAESFRLSSEGWGEFTIHAEIKPRNGHKITKRHWLTLEYPSAPRAMSRGLTATEKENGPRSTVFLSAGVSDLRFANALAAALKNKGLKVLKSDDVSADLPWEVAVAGMIKAADVMVLVLSGPPTSFVTRQIDWALSRELPIFPVVIGSASLIPENIQQFQMLNLHEANETEKVAPQMATEILKRLKTLPPKN